MTAPALLPPIVLGMTLATMLAAALHLIMGGPLRSLLLLWLRVQIAFWAADVAAALLHAPLYTIGELQIVAATAAGMAAGVFTIVTRKRV